MKKAFIPSKSSNGKPLVSKELVARRAGKSSAETAQRRPKDHQAAQSGSTAQRQGAGRNNVVAGAFKKARSLVRRGSGQRRGRLTPLKERARLIALFDEAVVGGASRYQAAAVIGISERTLKRWRSERGAIVEDQRPHAGQRRQPHQLTHEEEQAILNTCHRSEYQSLPPSQIVPLLADEGVYLASESSFYRVLKKHHQQHHRGRMKPRRSVPEPTSFTATGPNQVWSWDISYCASVVRGQHWYLYLIMDIYSRKIIAWEVHDTESGELAKQLLERALLREGCWHQPPVLHSDNGAPMTSYTLKVMVSIKKW